MTTSTINDVLDESGQILLETVSFLKEKVKRTLDSKGLSDDPEIKALLETFDVADCYSNLDSLPKQIRAMKENFKYIEPEQILLGSRLELIFDKELDRYRCQSVKETFEYVSVIEILTLLMQNKSFRDATVNEKANVNNDILGSFMDGVSFKTHEFFEKYPKALRLVLYYDEIEISNPLGSKAGIHKLGVFYLIVNNLPPHANSPLSNIHVIAIFNEQDRVKYGFKKIFAPLIKDLKRLEREEGVTIQIDGQEFVLRATIIAFAGDTAAVHQAFGFLGPGANCFCRLCLIHRRNDLQQGKFGPCELRSVENYNHQLNQVKNDPSKSSETGFQEECALHELRFFHVTKNFAFDIQHDFLEGFGPWELKLVLHEYICVRKLFSVPFSNGRVRFFQYGRLEKKNKPTANFTLEKIRSLSDHKLKQTSAQMWLLLRSFPFLVADKVPEGDSHMELIILLLRIMHIVFAPVIRKSDLPYLRALINDHHDLFRSLFPEINFINKQHHLVHHPECILQFGPLIHFWCMRFEAKHQTLKRHAHIMCNYTNPPKTVIRVAQCVQSSTWGRGDHQLHCVKCETSRFAKLEETQSFNLAVIRLRCPENVGVWLSESIFINGSKFAKSTFVCLQSGTETVDALPKFGKIVEILTFRSKSFFLLEKWTTVMYEPWLNAYRIEAVGEEKLFVETTALRGYRGYDAWASPRDSGVYLSTRFYIC